MITFGYVPLGGSDAANVQPDATTSIKSVTVQNAIFDQYFADSDTTIDTSSNALPTPLDWTRTTIMNAQFNGNLYAGNVQFAVNEIRSIRIKRSEKGSYDWITLDEVEVNTEDDLEFTKVDFLARANQEYEYALIPVMGDGAEGNPSTETVVSNFDGIWVCEKDIAYNALLDLDVSSTLNQVTSTVVPIGRRYPFVNKYGKTNYYTGSFSTTFIHMSTADCTLDMDNAVRYREDVEAFLTDGMPKIIKHQDGRIWLAFITDEISKDEGDAFWLPVQTVNFTEIGRHDSSSDLYNAGLITVNLDMEVNDELLS